jgi:hypothetical protein
MNLRLPNRVKQIDSQREKLLGYATDNSPIWCEAGAHELTGDEKHHLSQNLANNQRAAAVAKSVQEIQRGAAVFLEHSIMELAPPNVLNSYRGDGVLFKEWFVNMGFGYKQDGLKSVLLIKGTEVGAITAKCDPLLKSDIELMLKFEQTMAKGKEGLQ